MVFLAVWFMVHRIRYLTSQEPLSSKLTGIIEVDETYIGGKLRTKFPEKPGERPKDHRHLSELDFRHNSRKTKDGERTYSGTQRNIWQTANAPGLKRR
jgi:hypothetical protein